MSLSHRDKLAIALCLVVLAAYLVGVAAGVSAAP